jgi:hypothetical protein
MKDATAINQRADAHSRLHYQPNTVLAILDSPAQLGALNAALDGAQLALGQVEVLAGPDGLRHLRPAHGQSGVLALLRRAVRAGGVEATVGSRYAAALASGRLLVVVRDVPRGAALRLRDLIVALGGHDVRHYGRFTEAVLAA